MKYQFFQNVWVTGLRISYLIIVHLDLQEMWAYMLWFNQRAEPHATLWYAHVIIYGIIYIIRIWCIKYRISLNIVVVHINYLVYKPTLNLAYPVWTPIFLCRLDDNEKKFEGKAQKTRPSEPPAWQSVTGRVRGKKRKKTIPEKKHCTDTIISDGS